MPKIKVSCEHCGITVEKRSDQLGKNIYCSKKCFFESRRIKAPCANCGVEVNRPKHAVRETVLCSRKCTREWNSKRFTAENPDWNKTKMTSEVRFKLRSKHIDKGEGKSYEKLFGCHTHRAVAEQMLGRKLKSGEVVHHEDENKRNNDPSNLKVFASQAEHAAYHQQKLRKNAK